jgi:uncharacterized protein (DUF433 family)
MKAALKDAALELPMYGLAEGSLYLRVPMSTLDYWVFGRGKTPGLIAAASRRPRSLSFMNLLECHMLAAMRKIYNLRIPKIRRALTRLAGMNGYRHPLIEKPLFTDQRDILIREMDSVLNISRRNNFGQYEIPQIVDVFLERIEYDKDTYKFYPFVRERSRNEPKLIVINPNVGFGKPVIAGTGISTVVIASRFNARESIPDLAEEYGISTTQVEEAIRWETRAVAA